MHDIYDKDKGQRGIEQLKILLFNLLVIVLKFIPLPITDFFSLLFLFV